MIVRLLTILLALFCCQAFADPVPVPYGPESLGGVKPYGIEVRVICSKEVEKHQQVFLDYIKSRLERRGVSVVPEGNVVLRLNVTAITSDDGFFMVHFLLECLQTAYLAKDNSPTEATVWDAYRMGEYREQDLIPVVDDLLRVFLNDYISVN